MCECDKRRDCNPVSFAGYHQQEFVPNGTVERTSPPLKTEDIISNHQDGGIPIFRIRSPEETEAAHDLLSLSQSLPPLPPPSIVTIHQSIPHGEEPSSPTRSYRPLSPEQQIPSYRTSSPIPVAIPNYQAPIVYVVQIPPAPTPPISECSSDTENHTLQISIDDNTQQDTVSIQSFSTNGDDILILPLSPESDNRPLDTTTTASKLTNSISASHEELGDNEKLKQTMSVIVSPTKTKPPPIRQQSVITSTAVAHLNIPDRRMRKHASKINKTTKNNNNNDDKTIDHNGSQQKGKTRGPYKKSKTVSTKRSI